MDGKFKQLISEALEIDLNSLDVDINLDPEDNWDSVAILSTISEIDNQYEIQLDGNELASCRKISEIYALINKSST
jgi:acyl carrier protein